MMVPLRIVTQRGESHYFLKVVDWHTEQIIKTFFVYAGQSHETVVPVGSYRVKYASGKRWYGEKDLFGPETSYVQPDKQFDFAQMSAGYSGYTVELIPQEYGNLRSEAISPDQW
jgi:hypothetical protein